MLGGKQWASRVAQDETITLNKGRFGLLQQEKMLMPKDNTSSILPGAVGVDAAGDGGAVQNGESQAGNVAKLLSEALGKEFPNDEAALKSVKDTFNYVGQASKYKEVIASIKKVHSVDDAGALKLMESLSNQTNAAPASPAVAPNDTTAKAVAELGSQVEEMTFYAKNPDMEPYREVLTELRSTTGKSLHEVSELPSVKKLVEKAKAHDEAERKRSVLHSNSRLGQVKDKMQEAREAAKTGNISQAASKATAAVMEAFDLK